MSLARIRAISILSVLVAIAIGSVAWAIASDDQSSSARGDACSDATHQALAIPKPNQVTLRVYNATDRQGLANEVKAELAHRGFRVSDVGNDPQHEVVETPAYLRYGPKGAGSAQLVRAYVKNAEPFLDDREDDSVDLVLGTTFTVITPAGEIRKELSQLPPLPMPTLATC